MILELRPVTMAEAKEIVVPAEENKTLVEYFDKFTKLEKSKAMKLKEEIEGLKNIKLKKEHVVKIVDFMPRDNEDVHKIVNDVSLSEEEVAAILNVVKNY